jgi:hypothetical protein
MGHMGSCREAVLQAGAASNVRLLRQQGRSYTAQERRERMQSCVEHCNGDVSNITFGGVKVCVSTWLWLHGFESGSSTFAEVKAGFHRLGGGVQRVEDRRQHNGIAPALSTRMASFLLFWDAWFENVSDTTVAPPDTPDVLQPGLSLQEIKDFIYPRYIKEQTSWGKEPYTVQYGMKLLKHIYGKDMMRLGKRVVFSTHKQAGGSCRQCTEHRNRKVSSEMYDTIAYRQHLTEVDRSRLAYTEHESKARKGQVLSFAWDSQGQDKTKMPDNSGKLLADLVQIKLKLTNCKVFGAKVPNVIIIAPDTAPKTCDQQMSIFLRLMATRGLEQLQNAKGAGELIPTTVLLHMDGYLPSLLPVI